MGVGWLRRRRKMPILGALCMFCRRHSLSFCSLISGSRKPGFSCGTAPQTEVLGFGGLCLYPSRVFISWSIFGREALSDHSCRVRALRICSAATSAAPHSCPKSHLTGFPAARTGARRPRSQKKHMVQDCWYAPAVLFVAGAVAGGPPRPSRHRLACHFTTDASVNQLHTSGGALVQASQYLRPCDDRKAELLERQWSSILQKMATTG